MTGYVMLTKMWNETEQALLALIIYQSPNKTLTAEQIAKIEQQILNQLKKELGAELRAWNR